MITQSGAQSLRLDQRLGQAEDSGIKIDLLVFLPLVTTLITETLASNEGSMA